MYLHSFLFCMYFFQCVYIVWIELWHRLLICRCLTGLLLWCNHCFYKSMMCICLVYLSSFHMSYNIYYYMKLFIKTVWSSLSAPLFLMEGIILCLKNNISFMFLVLAFFYHHIIFYNIRNYYNHLWNRCFAFLSLVWCNFSLFRGLHFYFVEM